jgi:hypothetical protein
MAKFFAKHSIIDCPVPSAPAFRQLHQRSAFLFLRMKGLSAMDIQEELVEVPGSGAITYSAVAKSLRSARFEVKGAGSDEGLMIPGQV